MATYRNSLPQVSDTLFITDGGLETTVQTDYERTMMAYENTTPPVREPEEPLSRTDELSRTAYIPRDPSLQVDGGAQAVATCATV